MNKTAIDREDIREGDLIRAEWRDVEGGELATEFRVREGSFFKEDKKLFLLDRPEPRYELPTEPGLYTIAKTNSKVHTVRTFRLSSVGTWYEGQLNTYPSGKYVRRYLLEREWPLKRLVIEE